MNNRKPAQKVSLAIAYLCYVIAVAIIVIAGYLGMRDGTDNPIFASLAASVVFFIGSGIVLHVMGAANLPDLRIDRND